MRAQAAQAQEEVQELRTQMEVLRAETAAKAAQQAAERHADDGAAAKEVRTAALPACLGALHHAVLTRSAWPHFTQAAEAAEAAKQQLHDCQQQLRDCQKLLAAKEVRRQQKAAVCLLMRSTA